MFQTVCLQDKTKIFNCKSSIEKNSAEFLFQVTAVCFHMIGAERVEGGCGSTEGNVSASTLC